MITLSELRFRHRLCFVVVPALKCQSCFARVVLTKILIFLMFSYNDLFWFSAELGKNKYLGKKNMWIGKCGFQVAYRNSIFTINTDYKAQKIV